MGNLFDFESRNGVVSRLLQRAGQRRRCAVGSGGRTREAVQGVMGTHPSDPESEVKTE